MQDGRKLLGQRFVVAIAHPDDESFLAAGTLGANHAAGGSSLVVCGTCGEAGAAHLRRPLTKPQLARVRARELRAASRLLGVRRVVQLRYPDGRLNRHVTAFARRILAAGRQFRASAILGFGPDGISAHHDHLTAYRAARTVARRLKLPFWQFALPPAVLRHPLDWLLGRRSHGRYRRLLQHRCPNLRIPISGRLKLRCLAQHRSQLVGGKPFAGFPAFVRREAIKAEYFVVDPSRR